MSRVVFGASDLTNLVIQDARQQAEADRVGRDDDVIAFKRAINDPKRNAQCQYQEHL